jgi:hypothetical protein
MILKFVLFALIGRLIIFFIQKFPFSKVPLIGNLFGDGKYMDELINCDLCLGFWIYFFLALLMMMDITYECFTYMPVFSEFITALVTSFIMHLIKVGWDAEYKNIVVN